MSGPDEGFEVGEKAVDGGLEFDDRAEHAAFEPPSGQLGEEALDCIEPGARGRSEVEDVLTG